MANAPAVLRGYLDLNRATKRSHLDRRIAERIALATQAWIGCEYCVAAHTAAAQKLGLSDRDIALAKQGTATDPAIASIVAFGQQVIAAPAGPPTPTSSASGATATATSRSPRSWASAR